MCDVLYQVLRGLFVRGLNAAFGLHGPTERRVGLWIGGFNVPICVHQIGGDERVDGQSSFLLVRSVRHG